MDYRLLQKGSTDYTSSLTFAYFADFSSPPSANFSDYRYYSLHSTLVLVATVKHRNMATATPATTAAVAKTAPKKKAAASAAPATHPKYIEMVQQALAALKERGGSSRQAVLKYIVANFKVGTDESVVNTHLKMALKAGVKSGSLKQSKGTGASGSFRIGEKPKKAKAKKPKAPKAKKAAAAPKKKVEGAAKPKAKKAAAGPAKKKTTEGKAKVAKTATKEPKAAKKVAAKKPAGEKKPAAKKAAAPKAPKAAAKKAKSPVKKAATKKAVVAKPPKVKA